MRKFTIIPRFIKNKQIKESISIVNDWKKSPKNDALADHNPTPQKNSVSRKKRSNKDLETCLNCITKVFKEDRNVCYCCLLFGKPCLTMK